MKADGQNRYVIPLQKPHETGDERKKISVTPYHLRKEMSVQLAGARKASPVKPPIGGAPKPTILRKTPGSAARRDLVKFHESVEVETFERHSPVAKEVLAFLKYDIHPLLEIPIVDSGEEKAYLDGLLKIVERMTTDAVIGGRNSLLRLAVRIFIRELERRGRSQGNDNFAAHCLALLEIHREDLEAVGGRYDRNRRVIIEPSHDVARLGEVVASLRRIDLGMRVDEMAQVLQDVKNEDGGLRHVAHQLDLAMAELAKEAATSGVEIPFVTVDDIWQSWTNACQENDVRGHFVRQWWMHSGDLLDDQVPFPDALGRLRNSNQFDMAAIRSCLSSLLARSMKPKDRIALLKDFCDIGQPDEEFEKTIKGLISTDEARVDAALDDIATRIAAYEFRQRSVKPACSALLTAMAQLSECVQDLPSTSVSEDEWLRLIAPMMERFHSGALDVMEEADLDCRRQVATHLFASTATLEKALEERRIDDFRSSLEDLEDRFSRMALRATIDVASIERAINGALDFADNDPEAALACVHWMTMGDTEALGKALEALANAFQTDRESVVVHDLAQVIFRQQNQTLSS